MLFNIKFVVVTLAMFSNIVNGNYKPFLDNTLFSVNWPGPTAGGLEDAFDRGRSVLITTLNQEKYECIIPQVYDSSNQFEGQNENLPSEMDLLQQHFQQTSCSYKIESYWTYELCHGRYLRQYHEERQQGRQPKVQEYFLGRYGETALQDLPGTPGAAAPETVTDATPPAAGTNQQGQEEQEKQIRTKKLDGFDVPYFEVNFSDGTPCDLTGKPRRTAIHYMCQPDGRGQIYELKEISSCEYEVTVLTYALCALPQYQVKTDPVNKIQCHPLDGSPTKPTSLQALEMENMKDKYNKNELWDIVNDLIQKIQLEPSEEDPEEDWDDEEEEGLHDKDEEDLRRQSVIKRDTTTHYERARKPPTESPRMAVDRQILQLFLQGEHCVLGGTGWWKHELCHGKKITQFHEERNGKNTLILGVWDKEAHLAWLEKNPSKLPKPVGERKHVSHFYGSGNICHETNKPRETEVKLKCDDKAKHANAISIYMVEPQLCQYVMVVEAHFLCSLIEDADEYGILPDILP